MLYPELFKSFEAVRWNMDTDVPWDSFDAALLSDEQAQTIKMNAITEWSALPATEMFLRDNQHDSDFSAFMSVWFFEEQKHSLVLLEYLRRFRPDLLPTEAELHAVRFTFDPAPALETLMLHFCGEIRLNHWYRRASEWHTEPVIKHIYGLISRDEARHGGAYLQYMKRAIGTFGDQARAAFAKIGVLMASASRTAQALHPTNLHVNQAMFPNDTVQSRLPDPHWLERWLDTQIQFDRVWEGRVIERILHNASILFDRTFESVQDLNRYRKELSRDIARRVGQKIEATIVESIAPPHPNGVITFYYGSGSAPAWRVWLALEYKQLPYDLKLMSFSAGDLKTPQYRALNPRGKVPLIVDDGFALAESNAIVEYLEEQYPATPRLFPGSTRERSLVRRWIADTDDNFGEALSKLTGWILFTPKEKWKEERIAEARQAVLDQLDFIAQQIAGDYLAGSSITAADFALYPQVATLARCDLRKADLALVASRPVKIAAWARRIEALPYFDKTIPPHWKE